jgi:hypothetical protein
MIRIPGFLSPKFRRHFLDAVVKDSGQESALGLEAHPGFGKEVFNAVAKMFRAGQVYMRPIYLHEIRPPYYVRLYVHTYM